MSIGDLPGPLPFLLQLILASLLVGVGMIGGTLPPAMRRRVEMIAVPILVIAVVANAAWEVTQAVQEGKPAVAAFVTRA